MNRIAICLVPRFAAPSIFPSAGPGMSRTRWWTTCPSAGPSTRRSASIPRSAKLTLYNTFLFSILHLQSGYVTDQKCSKWPREVCTIAKEFRSKVSFMNGVNIHSVTRPQANPVTKCEKIPQRLCGPAGCGFVPGPEQCHDEVKTVIQDLPQEECDLTPQRKCK